MERLSVLPDSTPAPVDTLPRGYLSLSAPSSTVFFQELPGTDRIVLNKLYPGCLGALTRWADVPGLAPELEAEIGVLAQARHRRLRGRILDDGRESGAVTVGLLGMACRLRAPAPAPAEQPARGAPGRGGTSGKVAACGRFLPASTELSFAQPGTERRRTLASHGCRVSVGAPDTLLINNSAPAQSGSAPGSAGASDRLARTRSWVLPNRRVKA